MTTILLQIPMGIAGAYVGTWIGARLFWPAALRPSSWWGLW